MAIHTEEKPFECTKCDRKFAHKNSLHKHQKFHSEKRVSFSCSICSKNLLTSYGLETHFKEKHTDEKPFSCDKCDKRFSRKNLLEIHYRTHTGENLTVALFAINTSLSTSICQYILGGTQERDHTNAQNVTRSVGTLLHWDRIYDNTWAEQDIWMPAMQEVICTKDKPSRPQSDPPYYWKDHSMPRLQSYVQAKVHFEISHSKYSFGRKAIQMFILW